MKFSPRERSSLLSILARFPRQRMAALGDLVADEFVYGEIARVSREAPVLILRERERQIVPGGGANAVNNLCDLGAQVIPVGVAGEDDAGDALVGYFEQKGVPTHSILRLPGYQTPTKSRILGGLMHWQRQQIVRVDREPRSRPSGEVKRRLIEFASAEIARSSAFLISDYGYGAVSARTARLLRTRSRRNVPFIVDSRYALASYRGMTAATPNEPELEALFGAQIGNRLELLHELGAKLMRRLAMRALLVTRGRDGMVLFEARKKPQIIPIFGSDQAVDVTGAGDTVIAAFTLALASGASFLEAAQVANCAAGLVVMKRGTATATARELEEAIRNA